MPRATCRCGQELNVPGNEDARVVCPKCGARVRIRVRAPDDGLIRFFCPCGRRLKVSAERPPKHGQCPDCGQVVPVPAGAAAGNLPPGHPETPTVELSPEDLASLSTWAHQHGVRDAGDEIPPSAPQRAEVGLRICPKCQQPVHLGADACRRCGTPVPRR